MAEKIARLNHLYDLCDECRQRKDKRYYPGLWLRREIRRIERTLR